jgi:hypothetical protein
MPMNWKYSPKANIRNNLSARCQITYMINDEHVKTWQLQQIAFNKNQSTWHYPAEDKLQTKNT